MSADSAGGPPLEGTRPRQGHTSVPSTGPLLVAVVRAAPGSG
jgi:hypothetical protein